MFENVNPKDLAFKAFWTAASAALGVLLVEVTEMEVAWAPVIIAAINYALAYVRQQLGATPPDAPAEGPLAATHT